MEKFLDLLQNVVPRLEKLLGLPVTGLKIIVASYGTTEIFIDVTEIVENYAYYNKLSEISVNNTTFKKDPIDGKVKSLQMTYFFDDQEYHIEVKENSKLIIDENHKDGLIL
jgi:hypothetical protein